MVKQMIAFQLLLCLVGADTYKRIRALVAPTTPSSVTFATLKTVLKNKTKPKPTQLAERFRFHKRIQNEVEDVVSFDTALREISVNCGFTDVNDRLCDQLVIGLRNVKIKSELLSKDTVTYDAALKYAMAMETAYKEATTMNVLNISREDGSMESKDIFNVSSFGGGGSAVGRKKFAGVSRGKRKFEKCIRCGRTNHVSRFCSFKEAICHNCLEKGHIKPVCTKQTTPATHTQQTDRNRLYQISLDHVHGDNPVGEFLPGDHS